MNPNFKKNYAYSQSIYHLQENSGPIGMSLRGHPIFLTVQLFRIVTNMVRSSELYEMACTSLAVK